MIKLKHIDPRQLKKQIDPLDKAQVFYSGFILGGCRAHSLNALQIAIKCIQAITMLLDSQLINLIQRNNIIEMCMRLDLDRLAVFTDDIISIAQNQSLSDIHEALRVCFDRLTGRPNEIKISYQKRTKSNDTVLIDQKEEAEQRRIEAALALRKTEEADSLELVKRMLAQEEEELKRNRPDDSADCGICYGGLYDEEYLPLDCGHVFHKNCIQASLKNQIDQKKFPLKCPDAECVEQMLDNDAKAALKEEDFEKYQKFSLAAYVDLHGDEFSWCPTADCRYVFFYQEGENEFQCEICDKHYCLKCRVQWHKNQTCQEFEATRDPEKRDKKFEEFVKGSKFKQCPKCKFWVAKDVGCDSMTCRCGAFFCYKCGKQQPYSHGPCDCNNGAGQFGNMFARAPVVQAINRRRQNNRKNNRGRRR